MHFEQSNGWARFQQAAGKNVYVVSPLRVTPFTAALERRDSEGIAVEKRIAGPLKFLEINGWALPQDSTVSRHEQVLRDIGKRTGAVFVRWTPTREFPISNISRSGAIPLTFEKNIRGAGQFPNRSGLNIIEPCILTRQVPPRATLLIDLTKSEKELLNDMHEKTRYNIHLSVRKGVAADEVNPKDGFSIFWALMQDTAQRDKIGIHPRKYYEMMLQELNAPGEAQAHLFIAKHQGKPLAAAILITCGDTATYLHGGSSSMDRNLMAPHLLQWKMIQFAKAQGMKWYDMWGISPQDTRYKTQDTKPDSWAGITRFKMGFGGEEKEGAGTYDVVVKQFLYKLLTLAQTAKSILKM
ncbi:MAG: peptidoglycan bridge formation glycyltransferase FemA/FemB family protein [Patescibacteria group bacterium]